MSSGEVVVEEVLKAVDVGLQVAEDVMPFIPALAPIEPIIEAIDKGVQDLEKNLENNS